MRVCHRGCWRLACGVGVQTADPKQCGGRTPVPTSCCCAEKLRDFLVNYRDGIHNKFTYKNMLVR